MSPIQWLLILAFAGLLIFLTICANNPRDDEFNSLDIKPSEPGPYLTRFMNGKIQVTEEAFWNGAEWRYTDLSYGYCFYQNREWAEIKA